MSDMQTNQQEIPATFGGGLSRLQGYVRRVLVLGVLAAIMFATTYQIETLSDQNYVRDQKLDATVKVIEVRERIEQDIFARILDLNDFATLLGQNPDMNQTQFNIKALDLLLANTDIINIAAAPDLIVDKVFPLTGNAAVIGMNYRDSAEQYPPIAEAMETGQGTIVGPVDLVQGGRGLIMRKPVFATSRSGHQTPWGIVSVVLDYDKFIARLGLPELENDYDLVIQEVPSDSARKIFFGDPSLLNTDPIVLDFNFPFGHWQLAATPDGGWPPHRPNYLISWAWKTLLSTSILAGLWYMMGLFAQRRLAERQLSIGIEALDHGFVMFDADRRLVAFNNRYKELAGGSGKVRVGARYEDIVKANLENGLIPDAVGREEEWYAEWSKRLDLKAADKEQILADGRMIRAYDRPMEDGSVVGLRVDITDLKKAQIAAEAANEAKTEFMGVLSHELRTPLTVILGHAKLAKNLKNMPVYKKLAEQIEAQPEEAEALLTQLDTMGNQVVKMMDSLERSGNHLFTLISEILDFAKIESGTLNLDKEEIETVAITDPVVDQMRPMVEDKGLTLTLNREVHPLMADEKRLRQVMFNLIGNASKFTETGGITVTVKREGDDLLFSVADTGIGIAAEHHDSVFEAFQQVDSTNGRKYGGTGLGLAISRDMARAHGGDLTLDSTPGEGSTFTMRLPLNAPQGDAPEGEENLKLVA